MIDKVLYRCSRCGHTYLDAGDGAITPKGEQVDGVVPVCAECFVSNVTRESAHMVQVWPPRWIPVEERLPEPWENVLVLGLGGFWQAGYIDANLEDWWSIDENGGNIAGVTLWMYGPELPEDVRDD